AVQGHVPCVVSSACCPPDRRSFPTRRSSDLIGLDRQLGRRGVGVVVVVQLFATDDQAPGRDVGGGVGRLEVAVAPPVAQAIDDRSEEHTTELQSRENLVCRLLLEKKKYWERT